MAAELDIVLRLKDEATKGLQGVTSELKSIGASAKQASGGGVTALGDTLKTTASVGIAAIGGLTAAVAGIGGVAVSAAMEFDSAQRDMQASLGITGDEAKELGEVAKEVFATGIGESATEAYQSVAEAQRLLGDSLPTEQLGDATRSAMLIAETFDEDVNEVLSASRSLMDDFGLSSEQAFDFLSSGYQKGLDRSDDFLDSVTEYGTQFRGLNADAGEFFSLLETGTLGGILGGDKAADAIKELGLRINEMSDDTSDALSQIGIDAEQMERELNDGTIGAMDAFRQIQRGLFDVEGQADRHRLAVELLGTQYEDLGDEALRNINITTTSIDDLSGATDKLNVSQLGLEDYLRRISRQFQLAGASLGDALLPAVAELADYLGEYLVPAFREATEWIGERVPGAVETFQNIWGAMIDDYVAPAYDYFQDNILPVLADLYDEVKTNVPNALETMGKGWGVLLDDYLIPAHDYFNNNILPILQDLITEVQTNIPNALETMGKGWNSLKNDYLIPAYNYLNNNIIPILQDLITVVKTNVPNALDTMAKGWDSLIEKLRAGWSWSKTHLLPHLKALADVVGSVLSLAFQAASAAWTNHLKPALDGITGAGRQAEPAIRAVGKAAEQTVGFWTRLGNAIDQMTRNLRKLKLAIDSVKLPGWLTGFGQGGGGGGAFASGGVAPAGQVSLVGERGPELIMPTTDARIFSNQDTQRMLGTNLGSLSPISSGRGHTAITVNIHNPVIDNEARLQALVNTIEQRVYRGLDEGIDLMRVQGVI